MFNHNFNVLPPKYKKNIDKLDQSQWKAARMEHLPTEQKLRNQDLFSLEKGWLQGNLTAAPSIYGEVIKKMEPDSEVVHGVTRRGNGYKLKGDR